MCGIVGILARRGIGEVERAMLGRMNASQAHRGPDGAGEHVEPGGDGRGGVALAMRRLSIIDLGHGWQPLWNEDRSLCLVANGEVYNFVELRRDLESRGHRFATGSDCETILHLYEEHGDDCVQHLRGMYSFALLDRTRRRVLVARDRVGEKPLYLADLGDRLCFASEAKSLVAAGCVPFEPDPDALWAYLHWGYVPEPRSAIRGVTKLPAGHRLVCDLDRWSVRVERYWSLDDAPDVEGDATELLRAELERVAELVVRSDVPVGVCLSAGVDSGAVATLAQRRYGGTIHAVTVGFAGNPWQDERGPARRLAEEIGIPFHEVVLRPDEAAAVLPAVAVERDEPFHDPTGASLHLLMRRCRELGLVVMLSGLGGDELFWGYPWVLRAMRATERKERALRGEAGLGEYLSLRRPPLSATGGAIWLRELGGLGSGLRRRHADRTEPPDRMVYWDATPGFIEARHSAARALTPEFRGQAGDEVPYEPFTRPRPWPRLDLEFTTLQVETYLRVNGLAQSDRLSMAHGVELRNPLVDYRLCELAYALRRRSRDDGDPPKARLRSALAPFVPPWVFTRRKTGFSNPWREWNHAAAVQHRDRMRGGWLERHGILRPGVTAAALERMDGGRLSMADPLAESIVRLELWAQGMAALAGRQ